MAMKATNAIAFFMKPAPDNGEKDPDAAHSE